MRPQHKPASAAGCPASCPEQSPPSRRGHAPHGLPEHLPTALSTRLAAAQQDAFSFSPSHSGRRGVEAGCPEQSPPAGSPGPCSGSTSSTTPLCPEMNESILLLGIPHNTPARAAGCTGCCPEQSTFGSRGAVLRQLRPVRPHRLSSGIAAAQHKALPPIATTTAREAGWSPRAEPSLHGRGPCSVRRTLLPCALGSAANWLPCMPVQRNSGRRGVEAGCPEQRPLGREGPCSERRTTLYPVCPARWEVHHTGYHACAPSTNQPARRGVLLAARSSALPAGEGPCSGSCSPWTPPPPSGCTGSQLLACYPHNTLAREAGCPGRCPEQSPLAGSPEPCSGHRHRSTPSPSVPESCPAHSTSAREAGWQGGCPEQSPPGRGSYAGSYAPGQAPSITPAALCTGCAAHLLLTLLLHRSTAREAGCPGRRQKQSPPCMGGAMLCTEHPTTLCTGECSKLAAMHARATQISRGVNAGCPEQSTLAGSPLPCSGHQH